MNSIVMQFSFCIQHKHIYVHNSLLSNFNKSTKELGTVNVVVCAVESWILPEAMVTFELVELMT